MLFSLFIIYTKDDSRKIFSFEHKKEKKRKKYNWNRNDNKNNHKKELNLVFLSVFINVSQCIQFIFQH